jgi:hypothetical protein
MSSESEGIGKIVIKQLCSDSDVAKRSVCKRCISIQNVKNAVNLSNEFKGYGESSSGNGLKIQGVAAWYVCAHSIPSLRIG